MPKTLQEEMKICRMVRRIEDGTVALVNIGKLYWRKFTESFDILLLLCILLVSLSGRGTVTLSDTPWTDPTVITAAFQWGLTKTKDHP